MASDYNTLVSHLTEVVRILGRYRDADGHATFQIDMGPGLLRFSMDVPPDVLDQMVATDQ